MDISESELLENLEYVVERFLKIEGFPRTGEREDVPGRHHLAAQLQKRHGATIVAPSL